MSTTRYTQLEHKLFDTNVRHLPDTDSRLAALRREVHDVHLDTELVSLTPGSVTVRATIVADGRRVTEVSRERLDVSNISLDSAIEIAERNAVELTADRMVRNRAPASSPAQFSGLTERSNATRDGGKIVMIRQPASRRQVNFLIAQAQERGWASDRLNRVAEKLFGVGNLYKIDRRQLMDVARIVREEDVISRAS